MHSFAMQVVYTIVSWILFKANTYGNVSVSVLDTDLNLL